MNHEEKPSAGLFDVAIIGYGPTGLALACWLGAAGHNTVVVERWNDLYALPRAPSTARSCACSSGWASPRRWPRTPR